MKLRNIWLLGLLIIALAFGGVVNVMATMDEPEAFDIEGKGTGDAYGLRGVRVAVTGDTNVNGKQNLGYLQITDQGGGPVEISDPRDFEVGGNELDALEGTSLVKVSTNRYQVMTDIDGQYALTFVIPLDVFTAGHPTAQSDYDGSVYTADLSFTVAAGETNTFVVQTPRFNDVKSNVDLEDVVKGGDLLEFDVEMQEISPTNNEIRLLTMLPDFSAVDNTFWDLDNDGVVDLNEYDGTSLNSGSANWNDLNALARAVKTAINKGRLIIEQDDEDYNIKYYISPNSTAAAGFKKVTIYAIDYPILWDTANIENVYDTWNLNFNDLHIASWETADRGDALNSDVYPINNADADTNLDADLINFDNTAPNFDFVMVNPFLNPPKAIWNDNNPANGLLDDAEWQTVGYTYKNGDLVNVIVQIDPDDLNIDELRNVGDYPLSPVPVDVLENMRTENLIILGDLTGLLDLSKISPVDANNNGIPDEAEVPGVIVGSAVTNLGTNGTDDDFDGGGEYEDDEDSTSNGFYEPFLFQFTFRVTDKFKGATDRGLTFGSFRFAIKDSVGNIRHYSAWRETYDYVDKKFREVVVGSWIGPNGRSNDFGGNFPVNLDNPDGDEQIYPGLGPISAAPDASLFPLWGNGNKIVANWDNPWRIAIDGSAPTVSVVSQMQMNAKAIKEEVIPNGGPQAGPSVFVEDPDVAMGAAVVPEAIGFEPPDYGETLLSYANATDNLLTETQYGGNFIYEISGNEHNLVSMRLEFPSDNDVDFVKFMISSDGVTYADMKGQIRGDKSTTGIFDVAGNVTDESQPGVSETSSYHEGFNGDDDADGEGDRNDAEVMAAEMNPGGDGVDNDADGLTDRDDVDADGNLTEVYHRERDEDEDGIMDEDSFIVRVNSPTKVAYFVFDPVRLARVLGLTPDKPYAIKAVPYDKTNGFNPAAAAPLYVIFRVTGKGVAPSSGTAKAVLQNASGVKITDPSIPENREYVLNTENITGTVKVVTLVFGKQTRLGNYQ